MKSLPLKSMLAVALLCSSLCGQSKDGRIAEILRDISADSLRHTVQRLVAFGTRHTLSDTLSATRGIGAARRWIRSEFERYARRSGGRMTVAYQTSIVPPSARVPSPLSVANVVATLRPAIAGSQRIIMVTGHYDSRASDVMDAAIEAPGANDDGSGTAVVLELARVLAARSFSSTIVFAALAGEEQGLLGATSLAEEARARGDEIVAVLNNDIVGNTKGGDGGVERSYVRVFSQALTPFDTGATLRQRVTLGLENDGASRTLARYVSEIAQTYVPAFEARMVYRLDRFLRGGDHRPFHERGFAAVRFSEARENFDHQHQTLRKEGSKVFGDLPEFMDLEYCANVARVNAVAIASLANAPASPKAVRMKTSGLEYGTTIFWNRDTDATVAAYRVVYRSTSAPHWEKAVVVHDTTVTLSVLKDDMLFGVQALDAIGNASLPSIPLPGR